MTELLISSSETEYVLNPDGKGPKVTVGSNLAGRALRGLRLFQEGFVLDAKLGVVASGSDPTKAYVIKDGQFYQAFITVNPDGTKTMRRTDRLDGGYFQPIGKNKWVRVAYAAHHLAYLFAHGAVVSFPKDELTDAKVADAIRYATADAAGRAVIDAKYAQARQTIADTRSAGKADHKAGLKPTWDDANPNCAKALELAQQAGKYPFTMVIAKGAAKQQKRVASETFMRSTLAWLLVNDGWTPEKLVA